eukprot:5566088-Ditylum_brightwellii.AAC.1
MAPDTSDPLDKLEIKRTQVIIGMLLYYAKQVDPTMLVSIGTIAVAQSKGTEATAKAVEHLFNYCASQPNATIRYTPINMLLKTITGRLNNPPQRDSVDGRGRTRRPLCKFKEAAALRVTLEELGHLQPATLIQVENSTAYGVVNSSIRQRKSKATDI